MIRLIIVAVIHKSIKAGFPPSMKAILVSTCPVLHDWLVTNLKEYLYRSVIADKCPLIHKKQEALLLQRNRATRYVS